MHQIGNVRTVDRFPLSSHTSPIKFGANRTAFAEIVALSRKHRFTQGCALSDEREQRLRNFHGHHRIKRRFG